MERDITARTLFIVHSSDDVLFNHEDNGRFVVSNEAQTYAPDHQLGSQYSTFLAEELENGTPIRQIETPSFLRITMDDIHEPKDSREGFVFGCDSNTCDILLDNDQRRGVSREQFTILPDWNTGTLILKNISKQGTGIESRTLGRIWLHTYRSLPENEIVDVKLGIIEFRIRIPDHSNHRDVFLKRWSAFCAKFELQPPRLQKLALATNKTTNKSLQTKYILEEELGRGSQATVYRATHPNGGVYAVKKFHGLNKRNSGEAKILSRLDHSHIIKFYANDIVNGNPMMVMEFGGTDLQQEMARDPFNEVESKTGLSQLFEAVHYLHSLSITHRDIKPSNIIVHSRNPLCLKFTDFGMASESEDLKTFVGTPRYLAPELKQENHYTNKVDIWSLGIIALEFFYQLPEYPDCGRKRRTRWLINVKNHLASQHPQELTWWFIHSLLEYDPHRRPCAKKCLEHRFFAPPSEPIDLPGGIILEEPTPIFNPPQHHTAPTFENASEVSTIKGSLFRTAPQSPQVQISSSELSTIRLVAEHPIENISYPSHCEEESHELSTIPLEAGHSIQDIPSPSHRERVFRVPSSSGSYNSSSYIENESRELSTIPTKAGHSIQDIPSPRNRERAFRVPSSSGSYNSSSYNENESVKLLHHENPLRNTLYVGSFVAKMGREILPTVTEQEEATEREAECSQLPTYHAAQFESIGHVSRAASLPANSDDDDPTLGHWHQPAFPGSNYNGVGIIGARHNISHLANVYSRASQSEGYNTEADDIDSTISGPPTTVSLDRRFDPTSSIATKDFRSFYHEPREGHCAMDGNLGNSIESQVEDTSVAYAPTPGKLEGLDTQSIRYNPDSLDISVVYAPTPGKLEDLDNLDISVSYAPTPGKLEDRDSCSIGSNPDSLVHVVIGQQRVSMRASDSYLNATEICAAAGLDPGRSRRYLLPFKKSPTSSIELGEIWVPFSDGVTLSRSLNLDRDLEQLFVHASGPIRPSIEQDDEPLQPAARTQESRSGKRRRIGTHDKSVLEEMFERNPKPDKAVYAEIASRVSLDEVQVANWFRNQQRKLKRKRTR
ncbi:hypothetical protein F5B21DRAFT_459702 [Xylaria acuta]|nr:hypothetical protein F5B21DRAFT_459702 [Xylaria acuta]